MKKGAILLNLGTPESPSPESVAVYLKEFLNDPWVIDLPDWLRSFLVNRIIVPRRSKKSAKAYQSIWTDQGSPLQVYHDALFENVSTGLKDDPSTVLEKAMRYGKPTLFSALEKLKSEGVQKLYLFPLYPQYSLAATQSCLEKAREDLKKLNWKPELGAYGLRWFFHEQGYYQNVIDLGNEFFENSTIRYDHVLMSFHGLPELQIKKVDAQKNCLNRHCCETYGSHNQACYRAQCYETARIIGKGLHIDPKRMTVCFQSRLAGAPWIKPYTDFFYEELPKQGVRNLAVFCPSFVADCLETLEEVQLRGQEQFRKAGGKILSLVPSLNAEKSWVKTLVDWIQEPEKLEGKLPNAQAWVSLTS